MGTMSAGSASSSVLLTTSQVTIRQSLSTPALDAATGTALYLSASSNVDVVQVSTLYPYQDLGLWSYLGFAQLKLSVFHQERVLGW